ncbi:hypothetical protein F4809DRAFT_478214 [Biscogniauxia mediterranea]|nr:hypothetical protein F4809DRAFT_478214 [Biscogniauxia mediterranea]
MLFFFFFFSFILFSHVSTSRQVPLSRDHHPTRNSEKEKKKKNYPEAGRWKLAHWLFGRVSTLKYVLTREYKGGTCGGYYSKGEVLLHQAKTVIKVWEGGGGSSSVCSRTHTHTRTQTHIRTPGNLLEHGRQGRVWWGVGRGPVALPRGGLAYAAVVMTCMKISSGDLKGAIWAWSPSHSIGSG